MVGAVQVESYLQEQLIVKIRLPWVSKLSSVVRELETLLACSKAFPKQLKTICETLNRVTEYVVSQRLFWEYNDSLTITVLSGQEPTSRDPWLTSCMTCPMTARCRLRAWFPARSWGALLAPSAMTSPSCSCSATRKMHATAQLHLTMNEKHLLLDNKKFPEHRKQDGRISTLFSTNLLTDLSLTPMQ